MKLFQVLQALEGKPTANVYATHLDEKEARRAAEAAKNTPPLSSPERTARYFLVSVEAEELMAQPPDGQVSTGPEGRQEQLGPGGKPDHDRAHMHAPGTPSEGKSEAIGATPKDEPEGKHGKHKRW
jgi:hypothetical protein